MKRGTYLVQKRVVQTISTRSGNSVIEIVEIEIPDKKRLLELKPKNSDLEDRAWLLAAALYGITRMLGKCFGDWYERERLEGRTASYEPDEERDPARFYRCRFGQAGIMAYRSAEKKDHVSVAQVIRVHKCPLKKLGSFGRWVLESGLPVSFAGEVAFEYLTD